MRSRMRSALPNARRIAYAERIAEPNAECDGACDTRTNVLLTSCRISVTASRPIGGTKNEARRLLVAGDEGTEVGA